MPDDKNQQTLITAVEGAIATVTLNRPDALNALNATMFDELEETFQQLATDASVRVIVVTGAGERAFAAGADIRGLVETDATTGHKVSLRGQDVFTKIEKCDKPVIAAVNGVALGGGCELAMACTIRIASDNAKLGLPEVKLGLIPGYGGTQRLPRLVGRGAALKMMLTAQTVSANEALQIGLVDEVVSSAELGRRSSEVAQTIAGMAPLAISGILEAVTTLGKQDGFSHEADIFARLCGTQDKHEGLTAFLEKRPATWHGQ